MSMPYSALRWPAKYDLDHSFASCSHARRICNRNRGGRTMGERKNPATPERSTTRRQMIASITIAFGTLAVSKIWAESPRQTMKETPGSAANRTRTSLHEDIDMKAGAQRIYE